MMIVKGKFLLTVRGVIGMIKIQRDAGRRFAVIRDELFDQDSGYPVDVTAAQRRVLASLPSS